MALPRSRRSQAWLQSNEGDLRRATKTKGQVHRTDPTIHVQLHPVAQLEKPMHILGPQVGEQQRWEEGKKDLASVCMSGEHQVYVSPESKICEVRFVR